MTWSADGFRTRQLYHGGPVSHRHLHVLHSCPDIEGSNEVLEVRSVQLFACGP